MTTSAVCSSTSLAIGGNFHAPRASCAPTTSPSSRANLCPVGVDAAMISWLVFAPSNARWRPRMGPTHTGCANFLFHEVPVLCGESAHRSFGLNETLTIMEFPRAFNEEPLAVWPELLPERRLRSIMARKNARPSRRKNVMPARKLSDAEIAALLPKAKAGASSMASCTGEFTCKDFCQRVRQHDAGRAGRRSDGTITRMVQRVEQSVGHRPEHAQRERHQRLRLCAGGKKSTKFSSLFATWPS